MCSSRDVPHSVSGRYYSWGHYNTLGEAKRYKDSNQKGWGILRIHRDENGDFYVEMEETSPD
jgi:hypothetical protein